MPTKSPHQLPRARAMRHAPTPAEFQLWRHLRKRQLQNQKFRRQAPLGPYIVDFVCLESRLIIEADGATHANPATDQARTAYLNSAGYQILRFWNNDILTNLEGVLQTITQSLTAHQTSFPLPLGEGSGEG